MKHLLIPIFLLSLAYSQSYEYISVTQHQKATTVEFSITTEIDTLTKSFESAFKPEKVNNPQLQIISVFNFLGKRGYKYLEQFEAIQRTKLSGTERVYWFERMK